MENIIEKWNNSRSNDPLFLKELEQKISDKSFLKDFESNLEIIEGSIKSKIGVGTSLLNEYTVSSVAYNYSVFLHENNMKNIYIVHDGTFHGILFAKAFASTLKDEKINVYFSYGNQRQNKATAIWTAQNSKIKFDGVITFERTFNEKIYNISFFKKNGQLLSDSESKKISTYIWNTNYLTIEISNTDVPQLSENLNSKYVQTLKSDHDLSNISLYISNCHNFNQNILSEFVKINNLNVNICNYKFIPKKRNTITKKSQMQTFLNKTDVVVNFIENNNSFEFIIQHKKRKKFLSLNDLSILYLHYKFRYLDEKKDYSSKKVINDLRTSDFITYYSKKNKIKNIKTESLFLTLQNENLNDILLSTNGLNYFITEENINFVSDPLLNLKIFLEMVSYFKKFNKSLYDVLIEIYKEDKYYYFNSTQEKMSEEIANTFFNRLQNSQKINDINVNKIRFIDESKKKISLYLENSTTLIFEYLEEETTLKTYISIWENYEEKEKVGEEKYVSLLVKEKKILESINDLKKDFNVKKIKWKVVVKYSVFLAIFALFFWFIFNFIFNADKGTFLQIRELLRSNRLFTYFLPLVVVSCVITIAISCWINKRIVIILKQKCKLRHLLISQIISISISSITPLIYGGESIGYWYLRRKKMERAPIAAMFLVQSLLVQISIVIISLIFVPMGALTFFPTIFETLRNDKNNFNMIFIIVLMVAGFIFDIFAAVMIFLLTFNNKMQKSIVRNLNKLVEWLPFTVNRESGAKGAKIQYEFTNINKAAKKIFTSNVWYLNILIFVELLSYRMLMKVIDFGAINAMFYQLIKPEYALGGYFRIVAGNVLVRCVNALNFITPGGMGVSDWASRVILPPLFIDENSTNISNFKSINSYATLCRIEFSISWVVISGLLLFTIYIGEFRVDKYNRIRSLLTEEEIKLGNIKTKTTFYNNATIIWTIGIVSVVVTWILLVKFVI